MKYSAVIVAAGSGTRMKLGFNKVYAELQDGRTILDHTLSVFLNDEDCAQIIVVTDGGEFRRHFNGDLPGKIVTAMGGATRQESVYHGLMAAMCDVVMIHDGARPFITQQLLSDLKEAMKTNHAALPMVGCKDTIKSVKDGYVVSTIERNTIMAAQTPQVFRTSLLLECMAKAEKDGYVGTDDCSIVEKYRDEKIVVVQGDYEHILLTLQYILVS